MTALFLAVLMVLHFASTTNFNHKFSFQLFSSQLEGKDLNFKSFGVSTRVATSCLVAESPPPSRFAAL